MLCLYEFEYTEPQFKNLRSLKINACKYFHISNNNLSNNLVSKDKTLNIENPFYVLCKLL